MSGGTAHWFGLFGELFNLTGGCILAVDLLFRGRERRKRQKLEKMKKWAQDAGIQANYKEFQVAAEDFVERLLEEEASRLAKWGTGFLLLGFFLLALYHLIQIYDVPTSDHRIVGTLLKPFL